MGCKIYHIYVSVNQGGLLNIHHHALSCKDSKYDFMPQIYKNFDIKIPNKKPFLRHDTSAETHLTSTCAKGSPDPDCLTVTTEI